MHTVEPLGRELGCCEMKTAMEKLKRYKSRGIDQIQAELIHAENTTRTLLSEIHKLINSIWIRNNCHSSGGNLLLYLFIKRVIKLSVIIIEGYHCYQLH
jgi:hypothetical protein